MFDHIVGYAEIKRHLKEDIKQGTIQTPLVFSGSPLSARMTMALELARLLHCDEHGAAACSCRRCVQHQLLRNQELYIIGERSTLEDIHYFLKALANAQGTSAQAHGETISTENHNKRRNTLKQMVMLRLAIFLKRFDTIILSKKRKSQVETVYQQLFECLHTPLSDEFPISLESIHRGVNSIAAYQTPDVESIRLVQEQCYYRGSNKHKLVLIENLNTLSMTVMHTLLKFVEEPPESLHIIATAQERPRHAQNLASRFHWLYLSTRSDEEQKMVSTSYFGKEASSLQALLVDADTSTFVEQLCDSFFVELDNQNGEFWRLMHTMDLKKSEEISLAILKKLPSKATGKYAPKLPALIRVCKESLQNIHERNVSSRSAIEEVYQHVK